MPREIISIGVGQCGVEAQAQFFEAIAADHGLHPHTGAPVAELDFPERRTRVGTYFKELKVWPPEAIDDGSYRPRSIFVDLDPEPVEALRSRPAGKMLCHSRLVSGKSGADKNWATGCYTKGAGLVDSALEEVRREMETCDALQGFQVVHGLGGGTGGGFTSLLLAKLREEHGCNINVMTHSVMPSRKAVFCEPYNAILCMNDLIENTDENFLLSGDKILDMCYHTLKLGTPTSSDLGAQTAYAMAGVSSSFRFPGQLNESLQELAANMVPFPRIKFLLATVAPVLPRDASAPSLSTKDLTQQLLSKDILKWSVEPSKGEAYLEATAQLRGEASMKEAEDTFSSIKSSNPSSGPTDLKVSVCNVPLPNNGPKASGAFIWNPPADAIKEMLQPLLDTYDARRKAYLWHLVGEGMEEMEFTEAMKNVKFIINNYDEVKSAVLGDDSDDSYSLEGSVDGY